MKSDELEALHKKALSLLSKREKASDMVIVHGSTDTIPSTKTRIFKFFAAQKQTPDDPRFEIVMDEKGNAVDLAAVQKREGAVLFTRQDWAVDRTHLLAHIAAEKPFTITPDANEFPLSFGQTREPEAIRVSIPKGDPASKCDVYLLADTTGSMGPAIEAVRRSADALANGLTDMGLDIAFGVGSYQDFADDAVPFQHQLSPTNNVAAVQAAINNWDASHGGKSGTNIPEAQLFALDQIAENRNGIIGWRADAKRVIVWFGDAPGHEPICRNLSGLPRDITVDSLMGALASQGIIVIAISVVTDVGGFGLDLNPDSFIRRDDLGDYEVCGIPAGTTGQATRLADATGGIHLHSITPTQIATALLSAIANIVVGINKVHLKLNGPAAGFISKIDPLHVETVTAEGLTLKSSVDFKGNKHCTDELQLFEGSIDVMVDGAKKASKTLKIEVPPCRHIEIREAPSAAVERQNLWPNVVNRISVFAKGSENQLLRASHNGDPQDVRNWSWEDLGSPDRSFVSTSPFGIVSKREGPNPFNDFVHAFIKADNGHLYEKFCDGSHWSHWIDHGPPVFHSGLVTSPTVVTFRRTYVEDGGFWHEDTTWVESVDQLAAFVWGHDGLLHRHHEGWHGYGRTGTDLASGVGVANFAGSTYAYFVGKDSNLFASYSMDFQRTQWNAAILGKPSVNLDVTWIWRPGVVMFIHGRRDWLYAFVGGSDGHLWAHVWGGWRAPRGSAEWHDQDKPATNVSVGSAASVVTCVHNGTDQIYAFVRGDDNQLYVNYWDAPHTAWVWKPLGRPAAGVRSEPSAVVCLNPDTDPIYVFVRGSDDFLYMCHMNSGATNSAWLKLSRE